MLHFLIGLQIVKVDCRLQILLPGQFVQLLSDVSHQYCISHIFAGWCGATNQISSVDFLCLEIYL